MKRISNLRWRPRRRRDTLTAALAFEETVPIVLMKHLPSTVLGLTVVLKKNAGLRRGAEVASVDLHSIAWLAGLELGDLITMIATGKSGTLSPVRDGYQIVDMLQGSLGNIHLRVRRRKWTDADLSARVLQAAWRGTRAGPQI